MFKKTKYIEYDDFAYEYLGNGCKATGTGEGWRMSEDLYFRCVDCGYLMDGNPNKTDTCMCGKLHKDSDYGRFGSNLGDDAIDVYRRKGEIVLINKKLSFPKGGSIIFWGDIFGGRYGENYHRVRSYDYVANDNILRLNLTKTKFAQSTILLVFRILKRNLS